MREACAKQEARRLPPPAAFPCRLKPTVPCGGNDGASQRPPCGRQFVMTTRTSNGHGLEQSTNADDRYHPLYVVGEHV